MIDHSVPLSVDVEHCLVWKGAQRLRLTPKACAVLQYLIFHRECVVDKGRLLDTFWPDPAEASEAALTTCIREIRQKLQDNARTPHYIETIYPGRQTYAGAKKQAGGYRFIGLIASSVAGEEPRHGVQETGHKTPALPLPPPPSPPAHLFGRETEFDHLYRSLQQIWNGTRHVLFVTGEAGIGKTTLVDAFVKGLPDASGLWIGRGQCIAHYGEGEAYLPILEAFGRLGREVGTNQLVQILDRYAPTWLAQMPALVAPQDLPALLRRGQGVTQQRMLREMAEALEILTVERPLLLWLEDLQWSDVSTLQLLTRLALRPGPARLWILGTFRSVEVGRPLASMVHELCIKGGCQELPLQPLNEAAVAAYLAQRWANVAPLAPARLVRAMYHRTEGHPLFLGHVVDYLDAQGGAWRRQSQPSDEILGALLRAVPRDLHRMIETQVASLTSAAQRVLEVASVAGVEFSTPAVAAGGEMEIEFVEEHCAELARHGHFLQERGLIQWPDTTVGTGYRFVHALYQEVLYQRLPVRQRMAVHQRMGLRYEQAYDGQTAGMAPELALHFTQGREFRRAVLYRRQAAEVAMRRSAYQEAIAHLTHGLDILQELPNTTERLQQELTLRTSLGPALMATKGYAAAEVQAAYAQAQELCSQVPESPQLFPVLFGLWGFYLVRAEYTSARALAQQLLKVAQSAQEPGLLVEAHGALGVTAFYVGHLAASQAHLAQSLQYYDPVQHRTHALLYGQDPWVACRMWEGQVLWLLGYPDQALQRSQEAFAYAQELAHPFSTVFALYGLALVHQLRRESAACHEHAVMQLRLSEEQGFPFWAGPGAILLGWALAEQGHVEEGCQHLCDGLAVRQAMGAAQPRPYFSVLLAQVYGRAGKAQEALEVLSAALEGAADLGEQWCEAEVYRLQGELLLQATGVERCAYQRPQTVATVRHTEREAEMCFQKALALAQHQGAQGWALRATLSLSQLWARQGKQTEARQILGKMHSTLPQEGMQTADRQEASRLLAQWT